MYKVIPTNQNVTLLCDFYQISMGQAYWKSGTANKEAVFHMYFRKSPFGGNYAIACGLEYVLDYINNFKFNREDVDYLATVKGNNGLPIFEKEYLEYLFNLKLQIKVEAVPEGTVVFAHEPLIKVTGPILHCQLLETTILNIVNFQTLIATKASRVKYAAKGDAVLEFGARRAQGIDGALSASRAAYIGGCDATSNVLAGQLFDIPIKGTHAHSWVMSYDEEIDAFREYAKAMPNNAVFLVDTYDTINGVKNAIKIGNEMKADGFKFGGVRLDSGDLADLSIKARELLDAAGFNDASIYASNDLDEQTIESLKTQGAKINVWGVGTQLVTGGTQGALGGVYKLASINGQAAIKLSEQEVKTSNPGSQQVARLYWPFDNNIGDIIYNVGIPFGEVIKAYDTNNPSYTKTFSPEEFGYFNLLSTVLETGDGYVNHEPRPLKQIRDNSKKALTYFSDRMKRFLNPEAYFVGLEESLYNKKIELIRSHGK